LIAVFGEVALLLHDLGWRPLPCNGKAAILFRWNELSRIPWDRDDLIDAATEFSAFNCGIAADAEHVVVDLDVVQYELAHEIADLADQTLGPTPLIRVGREPKQARIYRNGSPGRIHSSKPHPTEIMAGTGMIVAFGIHPDTQQPYRWVSGASPLSLRANSTSIPTIDHLQLRRFLSGAGKALARARYVVDRRFAARPAMTNVAVFTEVRQRLRIDAQVVGFERAAIRLLHEAVDGSQRRHATAFEVVCAAAGRGWSEERIIRLFESHFAGWNGVSDDAFCRILDRAFRGDRHI
jgi:hypothetical protein